MASDINISLSSITIGFYDGKPQDVGVEATAQFRVHHTGSGLCVELEKIDVIGSVLCHQGPQEFAVALGDAMRLARELAEVSRRK